jgi:hypothetical protein
VLRGSTRKVREQREVQTVSVEEIDKASQKTKLGERWQSLRGSTKKVRNKSSVQTGSVKGIDKASQR